MSTENVGCPISEPSVNSDYRNPFIQVSAFSVSTMLEMFIDSCCHNPFCSGHWVQRPNNLGDVLEMFMDSCCHNPFGQVSGFNVSIILEPSVNSDHRNPFCSGSNVPII